MVTPAYPSRYDTVERTEALLEEAWPFRFCGQVIQAKRVGDLLCSAFEGGSNYWYTILEHYQAPHVGKKELCYAHMVLAPTGLGHTVITTNECDARDELHVLNRAACLQGLVLMQKEYPKAWLDFLNEDDDADTADVFLQLCLFGEVIYG